MARTDSVPRVDRRITRKDLEDRIRNVQDDVSKVKESTLGAGLAAGGVAILLLVIVAFLLGRKRGKKKYAYVEIRRV